MTETVTRTYYRIRFPAKAGTYGEFYSSNNGTTTWAELSKIKGVLTRGRTYGRGSIPFEDYEIVKFTEHVTIDREVVTI